MNIKANCYTLLIALLTRIPAFGQLEAVDTISYPVDSEHSTYVFQNLGNDGYILMYKSNSDRVELSKYDTLNNETNHNSFEVVAHLRYAVYPDKSYSDYFDISENNEVVNHRIDFKTLDVVTTKCSVDIKLKYKYQVSNNDCILLVFENYFKQEIYKVDIKTGQVNRIISDLPEKKKKSFAYQQITVVPSTGEFFLFTNKQKFFKTYNLSAHLNNEGEQIGAYVLNPKPSKFYQNYTVVATPDNEYQIWCEMKYIKKLSDYGNPKISGLCQIVIDDESVVSRKSIPFRSFKNFYAFQKDNKSKNIDKNTLKYRMGHPTKVNMHTIQIKLVDDAVYYAGEVYWPVYKTVVEQTVGSTAKPTKKMVLDYVIYSHAVIAKFDLEGNMIWNNSVELDVDDTEAVLQINKYQINKNGVGVLLINEGAITLTKFDADGRIVSKYNTPCSAPICVDEEKRKFNFFSLQYWYNDYMVYPEYTIDDDPSTERTEGYLNLYKYELIQD